MARMASLSGVAAALKWVLPGLVLASAALLLQGCWSETCTPPTDSKTTSVYQGDAKVTAAGCSKEEGMIKGTSRVTFTDGGKSLLVVSAPCLREGDEEKKQVPFICQELNTGVSLAEKLKKVLDAIKTDGIPKAECGDLIVANCAKGSLTIKESEDSKIKDLLVVGEISEGCDANTCRAFAQLILTKAKAVIANPIRTWEEAPTKGALVQQGSSLVQRSSTAGAQLESGEESSSNAQLESGRESATKTQRESGGESSPEAQRGSGRGGAALHDSAEAKLRHAAGSESVSEVHRASGSKSGSEVRHASASSEPSSVVLQHRSGAHAGGGSGGSGSHGAGADHVVFDVTKSGNFGKVGGPRARLQKQRAQRRAQRRAERLDAGASDGDA